MLTGVLPAPRTLPACALDMALFLALKASNSLEAFFKRPDVEKLGVDNHSAPDSPSLYFLRRDLNNQGSLGLYWLTACVSHGAVRVI